MARHTPRCVTPRGTFPRTPRLPRVAMLTCRPGTSLSRILRALGIGQRLIEQVPVPDPALLPIGEYVAQTDTPMGAGLRGRDRARIEERDMAATRGRRGVACAMLASFTGAQFHQPN